MAKVSRLAGSTGQILTLFIQDSTSTVGAGLTGLTNASAGLTCYYKRNTGTASVAVTLVTITTLGTYVSGGFKEIDAANMPGFYEFHPPDAAYAAAAKSLACCLRGAANMVLKGIEIELTAVDNQDAVRLGLTAIPNVAQGTAGALPTGDAAGRTNLGKFLDHNVVLDANFYPGVNIVDAGGAALTGSAGGVTVNGYAAGQDPATLLLVTAANKLATDGTGRVTVGTNADKTGYTASTVTDKSGYALTVTPPTAAAIATSVWTDATGADFTTSGTPGKILVGQLGGTFTGPTTTVFTAPALANAPSGTGASAAAIATAVWQDLTAGSDFSTANSIGSLVKTAIPNVAPTSPGGLIVSGTGTYQLNTTSGNVSLAATPPTAVQVRQELDANSTQLQALVTATTLTNTSIALAQIPATVVTDAANSTTVFTVSGITASPAGLLGMGVEFTGGTAANLKSRQTITAAAVNGSNLKITIGNALGSTPAVGDTVSLF